MGKRKESKYHRRKDGLLETTRTDRRTGKRIHFYGKTDREIDQQILEYTSRMETGRTFREWRTNGRTSTSPRWRPTP